MAELLLVLQLAVAVAFGALAIRSAASWIQQSDRRHGYLALALGSLTLVILIAPLLGGGGPEAQVLTDMSLVLFLVSGYALLMFRDSFVPFSRRTRVLIPAVIGLVAIFAIAVRLPAEPQGAHGPLQVIALVAVLVIWSMCNLEPIIRFWQSAKGRHTVEAARLRALSAGYGGILFVVIVGTLGSGLGQGWTLFTDLISLAVAPILYVSFAPPAWLRRMWREPEEGPFRSALHDLLLYSPDRATLAGRALSWAQRLVGGEGAFLVDSDDTILAARGIEPAQAAEIVSEHDFLSAIKPGQEPWRKEHMLVVPLYASSISAGLDRVSLNSRIHALERAKSDFLNVASHELRGPMTIIKGYLTMLEAGSLGDLSPKAASVLPLLISKSDEINWMLEQMLEASRLEEGRLELNKKRGDVAEITDMAIDGVRMLLRGHDVRLDEPAEPLQAELDPDRFQMVVRNLLSNAAKYSPAGTDIIVRIKRDDGMAAISVIDQGVGISKEDQANLFTRFGRIPTSQHVQGTGLGLWLSREIARMHDGDLTVQSAAGTGSTFVLKVPLTQ